MSGENGFQFDLSFKGQLVENSVDAFDVANTIIALSTVVNQICEIEYGETAKDRIKLNINAFQKGSLVTEFLIFLRDNTPIAAAAISAGLNSEIAVVGRTVLSDLKTIIEVRKMLKGEKPKDVTQSGDGHLTITSRDNSVINITVNQFKAVQDQTINKNIAKAFSPLTAQDTEITEISVQSNQFKELGQISVDSESATLIKTTQEMQIVPNLKYKGFVSKLDTQAKSGYLSLNSKRMPFYYKSQLPTESFELLVSSLGTKMQIYLIGQVEMDYESNPRQMNVERCEIDKDLFN